MYYYEKISFIFFEYGGLALSLYFIIVLKAKGKKSAAVDLNKLRSALVLLTLFVLFTSAAYHDFYEMIYGQPIIQIINNLFAGVFFLLFLLRLWKSISFLNSRT